LNTTTSAAPKAETEIFVADVEQNEEQRKHGGGRRRAKKIDDELDRAVNFFRGAEHHPERDRNRRRNQNGERGAFDRLREIRAQLAMHYAVPHDTEGRSRLRQKHRIDHLAPNRKIPNRDQADNADDRQEGSVIDALHPLPDPRQSPTSTMAITGPPPGGP
jgi:hypothetical protein